jgi:hypothetical protein
MVPGEDVLDPHFVEPDVERCTELGDGGHGANPHAPELEHGADDDVVAALRGSRNVHEVTLDPGRQCRERRRKTERT